LKEMNERGLIASLRNAYQSPAPPLGMGDDCSVITVDGRTLLVTMDMLLESTHLKYCGSYRRKGRMAMSANLSDVAAMGGKPLYAFTALGLPPGTTMGQALSLARGISEVAGEHSVSVLGGDTKRARELTVSITLIGEAVGKPLLRSGAKPGDVVAVTGVIGRAARAYAARGRGGRAVAGICDVRPRMREGIALARSGHVSAATDITDGLALSLHYIASASGAAMEIDLNSIPFCSRQPPPGMNEREWREMALCWGGDYELLFTADSALDIGVLEHNGCGDVHIIGKVTEGKGVYITESGRRKRMAARGYDSLRGTYF
jgi:thiamine-monophosphate kinase